MANEKRTLVELSPHGVQLLAVSGRTVTGWIGRTPDAKEAVTEFVQAAEGAPFTLLAPRRHAVARGEGDAAGAAGTFASELGVDAGAYTSIVTDAATGTAPGGAGAWVGVAVPNESLEETKQVLGGFGLAPSGSGLALAAHIGAVVTCLRDTGSEAKVAIWALGESSSSLTVVTAAGVGPARMVPVGQAQVFEAVQAALGLKFKAAAQKLFANEGYDFSAAAPAIGEKLATALSPSLTEAGGAGALHVVGFSSVQASWLTGSLASALGVSSWTPDFHAWLGGKGWTIAGDVTLPPVAVGVVGVALNPTVWISSSASKPAPVVGGPAPLPVKDPAQAPAPAKPASVSSEPAPIAASAPVPVPPASASAPVHAKPQTIKDPTRPTPVKPVAPVPKTSAPVAATAKPVTPSKPATPPKPPVVAAPVAVPAPTPDSIAKQPATIGGIPVPFVISGVALSLLVGVGVFFMRSKDEAPAVAAAPASPVVAPSTAPKPETTNEKSGSSLADLLAPPPVPGIQRTPETSKPASTPVRSAAPATPAPSSSEVKITTDFLPASDLVAQSRATYANRTYDVVMFDGKNLISVRRNGRTIAFADYLVTTHTPNKVWRALDRMSAANSRCKRSTIDGGERFEIVQENSRAYAEFRIDCMGDRVEINTWIRPIDYTTGAEGDVFTNYAWNVFPGLMPEGGKLSTNPESAFSRLVDGSFVRFAFQDGFYTLMQDEEFKARMGFRAYLSGPAQVRINVFGKDSRLYGPIAMSVRFE